MKVIISVLLVFFCFSSILVKAQREEALQQVLNETNVEGLQKLAVKFEKEYQSRRQEAYELAKENGWPVFHVESNGRITELQYIDNLGNPVYYQTTNEVAAATISTDRVWPNGGVGLNLTGDKLYLGEWDGGKVLTTHREFEGRVKQQDNAKTISNHSTHVAGTLVSAGKEPGTRGMAYKAKLDAYDWNSDESEMAAAASKGLLISNHSYATICGWYYNPDSSRYEWYGDPSVNAKKDYKFGFYDIWTNHWDTIAYNAPYYLIVKSIGNDRNDKGPGSGKPYYYLDHGKWVKDSLVTRDDDGEYDCATPKATAKNILTVGAVQDIPSGYSKPSDVVQTSFSSWGPADDGRIKPDIVGDGYKLYSTSGSDTDAYAYMSGTSMSSPNVAGSLLLLQEHYLNKTGNKFMKSATLKGLVINTADEAGPSEGPDYMNGWGLMNTETAAKTISDMGKKSMIREAQLKNKAKYTVHVLSNGNDPLVATLCWTDVPGRPAKASLNPTKKMLVNDLDMRIIDPSNNQIYPYILDPAKPSKAATKGDNNRDNVEKIYIPNPSSGSYTILISHKNNLYNNAPQNFSLVVTGLSPVDTTRYCEDTVIVTKPYGYITDGSGNDNYGPNSDCYWIIDPGKKGRISIDILELNTESNKDILSIYDGASTLDPLLGSFSGNSLPGHSITSSGNKVMINFNANAAINAEGWKIRYTVYNGDTCHKPKVINYTQANKVDKSYLNLINANYTQADLTNKTLVNEVGNSIKDFVEPNGSQMNIDFPIKMDSMFMYLSHENNSGKNDTLTFYIKEADSVGYPSGPIIWDTSIVTKKSLSPSGNWTGNNSTVKLGFKTNFLVTGPFFCGFTFKGSKLDSCGFVYGFKNIGPKDSLKAAVANYGNCYRKYPYINNAHWLPNPDGTDIFNDWNKNNTFDQGEAQYMQVLALNPVLASPYALASSNIIQLGKEFLITTKGSAYQWFRNDTLLTGETKQRITPNKSGNYKALVTDAYGCQAFTVEKEYVKPAGIKELSIEPLVNLYPNPATNNLNINITIDRNENVQLKLMDAVGKEIVSKNEELISGSNQVMMNLPENLSGIYLLQISLKDRQLWRSISITK